MTCSLAPDHRLHLPPPPREQSRSRWSRGSAGPAAAAERSAGAFPGLPGPAKVPAPLGGRRGGQAVHVDAEPKPPSAAAPRPTPISSLFHRPKSKKTHSFHLSIASVHTTSLSVVSPSIIEQKVIQRKREGRVLLGRGRGFML